MALRSALRFRSRAELRHHSVSWSNHDPSFHEADLSDNPPWLQAWYSQPRTNAPSYYTARYTTRVRALLSVDDALKSFINTLNARGELTNTLFILTGDNGWLMESIESTAASASPTRQPRRAYGWRDPGSRSARPATRSRRISISWPLL
ncbi:MAG: sulfatase-like hydrolase/transferase [Acidimicrobiia bacterium]